MATRPMVLIDEELCNGCGDCVPSCAEGAIQIIDGKAKLMADNLCDGLGACLGDCPEGAISVVEREAADYDEHAVEEHLQNLKKEDDLTHAPAATPHDSHDGASACGCPGSMMRSFVEPAETPDAGPGDGASTPSALRQWPIQLHLVSPTAPYFEGSDVLLAADCTAFSMGGFHNEHLKGKSLAVACPKLDQGQDVYLQKLVTMIDQSKINTLTVMIMEVPCCAGLVQLASQAVSMAGRKVPLKKITVGLRGDILGEDWL